MPEVKWATGLCRKTVSADKSITIMDFKLEVWSVKRLVEEYDAGNIQLNPPYQRNPVWTLPAQQSLIESVLLGKALPNFFLLDKGEGKFEMIDGQQRARTLIAYWKNILVDHEFMTFDQRLVKSSNRAQSKAKFLDYPLSVTIVTSVGDNETIESYYALLNSAGLRLNRPELKKAEYFQTNFLKLVMDLAEDERIKALKIFNATSASRMNDVDFVSELVALIKFGISDKKEKVDQLYEDDLKLGEMQAVKLRFESNLGILQRLNHIIPLIRTRYKQKNDFYTLFYLFDCLRGESVRAQDHVFKVLVKIGPYIKPSQVKCEPFREYAHNCVTQSNSKAARLIRHQILWEICCNKYEKPNPVQVKVLDFFGIHSDAIVNVDGLWTFDPQSLHDPSNHEFDFLEDEIQ